MKVACLRQRVLLERVVRLQRILVGRLGDAGGLEIDKLYTETVEQGAKLPQLPRVPRRHEHSSPSRKRGVHVSPARAERCASSSRRIPATASSSNSSSSRRSKAPCSPVP